MKTYLIILLALISVSACNDPAGHKGLDEKLKSTEVMLPALVVKPDNEVIAKKAPAVEAIEAADLSPREVAEAKPAVDAPKIIKTGDISFETSNLKATRQQLISSLKKLGGYVEEDRETDNGDDNRKEFRLNIKIPAKNFDAFLSSVSNTAIKIDSKNISISDVTTQFIDTKTRLDNKKLLESRYRELLTKALKISEMLEIENKLAEIRADIESSQGQLNYLNNQVAYSSLAITFYTKQQTQIETSVGFGYKLSAALSNGVEIIGNLFFSVLSVWPIWVLLAGCFVGISAWRKKLIKKA